MIERGRGERGGRSREEEESMWVKETKREGPCGIENTRPKWQVIRY